MPNHLSINLAWSVLLLCAYAAVGKPDADGYERVPLVNHADLSISLLVRPVASAADGAFIGFLIDNKTDAPLQIPASTGANFAIEPMQRLDRVTRKPISTGYLAGGNEYDLFHRDVMVLNTQRPPLPMGRSWHTEALSDRMLGALGIVAQGANGFTIQARFHLDLHYNGAAVTTPPEGVPFQFDWIAPDDAGIERMKKRLIATLREGDPGGRLYYVLATHLDHPTIASAASSMDLIAGLEAHEQGSGAEKILQHIDAHRTPGDGLVDYALRLIERRDHLRMHVLSGSTSLRDVKLIEPLTEWTIEPSAHNHGAHFALVLLSKQIDLAPDRDALTKKLGESWLERSPTVRSGQWKPEDAWRWQDEVRRLALTRDKNLIPTLRPYLDRTDIVSDVREMSAANDGISTRACDTAYNVIMDLLGREGERFDIGIGVHRADARARDQAYARRDAAIAKLKQELAAMPSSR